MVFVPDEKLKRKMSKDGSVLKYMYGVAGAGKGLIAAGVMLAVIGVMLIAALMNPLGTDGAVKMGAVVAAPGLLLVALGIVLQQKRMNGWMKNYGKKIGFTEAQLREVDEEFKQPGTVLISFDKDKDNNSLKKMGFITAHYVRFPGVSSLILPLQDMVACFYTKKYLCGDGGYDHAFMAYSTDVDHMYFFRNPPEKASMEIADAIEAHNPMIIKEHHFTYEGKEYDAIEGADEVIALHKRLRAEQ